MLHSYLMFVDSSKLSSKFAGLRAVPHPALKVLVRKSEMSKPNWFRFIDKVDEKPIDWLIVAIFLIIILSI